MTHKICFKAATKDIAIVPVASDTPEGFINIGDYAHDTENDPLGAPGSHVLFHHIQKALYPLGVQDMAYINVSFTREIESAPVIISCVYPFDSLDADVTGLGFAGAANMTGQTANLVVQGGLVAEEWRRSTSGTLQTVDTSAGKKVVECVFAVSDTPISGNFHGYVRFLDSDTMEDLVSIGAAVDAGSVELSVTTGGVPRGAQASDVGDSIVGVEFDSASSTIRVILNNSITFELTSDAYTGATCLMAVETKEGIGCDAADAGKTLDITVRTNAGDFVQMYGASATDVCGNVL